MAKVDHRSPTKTARDKPETPSDGRSDGRGREATAPGQLPKAGWQDILLRVKEQVSKDNVSIVAAGVAFYLILALFPALAATVSLYGLVASPEQVQQQLSSMSQALPQEAQSVIQEQLTSIVKSSGGALGFGAITGLLLTLWSAAKGMKALMTALNIAYDEEETRSFVKFNGVALLLTVGALVFLIVTLFLITTLPTVLQTVGLGSVGQTLLSLARWPILAVIFMVMLTVLYRYAPCRDEPRWQWVSWGAGAATILWLIGSSAFAFYANNYGTYNKTYGSLGAAAILLMWFWITAFIIMLGAELNSEMERQTRKDTTVGTHEPMGQRGAYAADNLGRQP